MTRIERLATSMAFISSISGDDSTRRTGCGSRQMYGASRIENWCTNCPNCAAPSSTIWIAPDEVDSMTSRDEPSCPAGKVWISTEPPVSSRTCLATRSIIVTDGWLVGSTVAQRSVVVARARTGKAPIATLASPAPIHSRRVQRTGLLIASSFAIDKVESVAIPAPLADAGTIRQGMLACKDRSRAGPDRNAGCASGERLAECCSWVIRAPALMLATPRAERVLPTGTITFLFTDIEGSTRLWERHHAAMQQALAHHDAILRDAIESNDGYLVKTTGDGAHAAFAIAADAIAASLAAQRALTAHAWGELSITSRMAMHSGAAEQRGGDYYGPALNRAARLMEAGHGGQILLSLATEELVRDHLPAGIALRDMGERRLKDLIRPERVFQVVAPDLPADFPPLKTLDARPNNLPAQRTPFIGRAHAIHAIKKQLSDVNVRLLTLSGVGGTGKTRLALQAAADMVDEFEHGVFFVPLAALSDPALVLQTIAQPFAVREVAGRPLQEQLKDYLREKQMLLVLDNFEQVIDAAPLISDLLAAAPRLKVLVTSREVLRLSGETDYPVPPLALPDLKRLPPLERLTQYEAVALFIERAVAVRASFTVTNENAPAVAEICYRLDGLPLAIELAAARVRVFPPQALLRRPSSQLKLLTGGARDRPTRQQTLWAAIDWSYSLLNDKEQRLF